MCTLNSKVFLVTLLCGQFIQCLAQQINCGVPRVKEKNLIVRGSLAKAQEWPWHVAIFHRSFKKAPEYACGGSLLSKSFVLTAKHCTLDGGSGPPLTNGAISVRVGVEKLYEVNSNIQEHRVLEIHVPNQFCCKDLRNDIALLELKTAVQFNNFVVPVCLPKRDVSPGELGTVVGFGFTEFGDVSESLVKASMPVVDSNECLRSDRVGWGGILDEGLFCAGYQNGTSVCNGDSGGGLMFKRDESWQVAGVVAFSLGDDKGNCQHNGFGGFTKVYKYLEWIKHVTGLRVENAGEVNSHKQVPTLEFRPFSDFTFPSDLDLVYKDVYKDDPISTALSSVNNLPADCGRSTTQRNFPWMAVFFALNPSNDKYWTAAFIGSLISKRYILIPGNLESTSRSRVAFDDGWSYDVHEDYFKRQIFREVDLSKAVRSASLGLMRLDPEVQFNEFVQPVCLPQSILSEPPELLAIISSLDGFFEYSSEPKTECSCTSYSSRTSPDVICTKNEGNFRRGTPVGISVVKNNAERFVQIGFKIDRCTNTHVSSDVRQHTRWISDNIRN